MKEGTEQKGKTIRITPAAQECISKLRIEFETKMSDDLNTAHILTGAFQEALKFINGSLNTLKVIVGCSLLFSLLVFLSGITKFNIFQKKQQKQAQLSTIQSLFEVKKEVKEVLNVLGLLSPHTYSEVIQFSWPVLCYFEAYY